MEKWLKSCKTMKQRFATEQFLTSFPVETRFWVRERDPKTCAEAGELAEHILTSEKTPSWRDANEGGAADGGTEYPSGSGDEEV